MKSKESYGFAKIFVLFDFVFILLSIIYMGLATDQSNVAYVWIAFITIIISVISLIIHIYQLTKFYEEGE